ncbi:2-phospho-L-lactate guanylyltransferase [Streptomyces sp. V4I2]|uniref:2-phospho-L-lactate guanylyltransferase n=1 Tax=Streptomyces sp. V4I2 TaxID=3042280 RepID=UPI002785A081|nr:2-phospho-L-lactate guanylyltransferase [Streptomyces sp. V4I2]MDQ1050667.1 2-phospho-L-lactate guanylyltransferase [Streptomyces sp. V4I2]
MWSVVIPVKPFSRAKSRLAAGLGPWRHELAHAFFLDTLWAVRNTEGVRTVVVVTADPLAAAQTRTLGAVVCPDAPGVGLNAAVRLGAAKCRAVGPEGPVAVLTADLPGLRPQELDQVLREARHHRRAFVADHTGEGTTVLTALTTAGLAPAFGSGSGHRHALSGAFPVEMPSDCGIRLDVDTPEDLARVALRGVGPYTAALFRLRKARYPVADPVQGASSTASS